MIQPLPVGVSPDETNSHVFSRDGLALSVWLLPDGVYLVRSPSRTDSYSFLSHAKRLADLEDDLAAQYWYRLRRSP